MAGTADAKSICRDSLALAAELFVEEVCDDLPRLAGLGQLWLSIVHDQYSVEVDEL
jgi:hypothetical protein